MIILFIITYMINIPLGFWRSFQRKFSLRWFIAIHASVPVIIILRHIMGISVVYAALFVALAIAGQLTGTKAFPALSRKYAEHHGKATL